MAEPTIQDKINEFFNKAHEDQVMINLMFMMDMCQFSIVQGQCTMIKNKHFVVRVPMATLKEKQIIWGADVNGYFSVRTDDRHIIHFKSKLVRLYNAPPDAMFLIFPLPKTIDAEQRRNSRRVDLDSASAEAFGVWYNSLEGGDDLSLPKQVWKEFHQDDCDLGELSASGMRLDFQSSHPLVNTLAIDTIVLLRGDFGTKTRPQPLFVLGTVVRKMPRKDKEGLMSVGCHFTSWRKVSGPDSEQWFKADPQEGIAIISTWLGRNFRGSSSLPNF